MKRRIAMVLVLALLVVAGLASIAGAGVVQEHKLTVDGVEYLPTKVVGSGPTVHYETPDVSPEDAFTERHVWVGNGSENLPCDFGIHWIDNANVLTVSHCLDGEETTTTTTEQETTTTTEEETTTTTEETTTTTEQVTTTTEQETTTTTEEEVTTTTAQETTTTTDPSTTTSGTLPFTGIEDVGLIAGWAIALLSLGTLAVLTARSRKR